MYIAGATNLIETGDNYFSTISKLDASGHTDAFRRINERQRITALPVSGEILKARINYSRYIADCPNCSNAEFVFEDKLFLCSVCHNGDIQGKVRRIELPTKRVEIENILVKRKIRNRNWATGETIKQLEQENISNGLEIN